MKNELPKYKVIQPFEIVKRTFSNKGKVVFKYNVGNIYSGINAFKYEQLGYLTPIK